jgi:hypothetical protein
MFLCVINFSSVNLLASENGGHENNENSSAEKLLGYIKSVYNENQNFYLDFDYVEWLTGREAIRAGIEDDKQLDEIDKTRLLEKLEEIGDYDWKNIVENFRKYIPPSDFYIYNQSDEIKTFEISKDVKILMQTLSHRPDGNYKSNEEIDLVKFIEILDFFFYYKETPFHIKLSNGLVTEIIEQYVP